MGRAGEPVTSLGIDAEPHEPLPDGLLGALTMDTERARLGRVSAGQPAVYWDRVLFSAKESIFKAWYPLTQRELGLEDCQLSIDPVARTFAGTVLTDPPRGLAVITGRYVVERGFLATAAAVGR